ncbi:MAG: ABC transporter substrate-binding protein [Gaiellaceae bacterium]
MAARSFRDRLGLAGARRGFRCISAVAAVALMCAVVAVAGTIPVPSSSLTQPGSLKYCSDISSAPGEFYGPGHIAQGVDIDVGSEIAKRLGLKPVWVNTAFAGIIPALQAKHCDAIISELFIKPPRKKVVDFVAYQTSGEELLVLKGNHAHITGLDNSLCGKKVAAETGTTVVDYLQAQDKTCKAAGKDGVTINLFLRDADAFGQLIVKHVDAYGTTTDTAGYRTRSSNQFQVAGKPFGRILVGIATNKSNKPLHEAIAEAYRAMKKDGTYAKIYEKWGLQLNELK